MSQPITRRRFLVAGASVLAVGAAALVGGTYARYKTDGKSTDFANVAKFGVSVTIDSTGTFSTEYKNGSDAVIVKASGEQRIVAPGTSGTLADAKVTGTTEVAVRVAYKLEFEGVDNWTVGSDDDASAYFPIVFTVGGKTYRMGASPSTGDTENVYSSLGNEDGLLKAVEGAVEKTWTAEYAPNVTLASQVTDNVLSWEWPIAGSGEGAYQTDEKDTALGKAASGGTAVPKIGFKLTVTVSQIDSFDGSYTQVKASSGDTSDGSDKSNGSDPASSSEPGASGDDGGSTTGAGSSSESTTV
jgi:hypothetical protein